MSFSDFTSLYGTTAKAKFWCDYMTGLRGQLQALETSGTRESHSVWSRVATSEVLLYDVLYGEYFPAVGNYSWPHHTDLTWLQFYLEIFQREILSLQTPSWLGLTRIPQRYGFLTVQSTVRYTGTRAPEHPGYHRTNNPIIIHIHICTKYHQNKNHQQKLFYFKLIATTPLTRLTSFHCCDMIQN